MSIIVQNEYAWVLDHKLASVSTVKKDDGGKGIYRMKSDLFEIVEPYCMDSQYEKLHQGKLKDEGQKRKRKRKRQTPFNPGEKMAEEFHNEVKDCIWMAYESLVTLGQEVDYFQDISAFGTRDNNRAARLAAHWDGSSLAFIEMCELSQKDRNQTEIEHRTDSQQQYDSNDVEPLKNRNQYLTAYQVTEVKDLSVKGVVNVIWQNNGDISEIVRCKGENYIIPPHSKFLMSDLTHLNKTGKYLGTYDLIVMDPPWTNKSVKRKKKYYTMDSDMMLDLPLGDMMNPGCLVVVWVTNKHKHIQFITEQLFPANNIQVMARWFWLKVTKTGQCVFDFHSPHKKPYETIIIGKYRGTTCNLNKLNLNNHQNPQDKESLNEIPVRYNVKEDSSEVDSNQSDVEDNGKDEHYHEDQSHIEGSRPKSVHGNGYHIPDNKVIISVPCSLHSKKPPLTEVLKLYLPDDPECLELFARNLLPGWTSWGNEVLLHQHVNFFEEIT